MKKTVKLTEIEFRKTILADPFTSDEAVEAYFREHKQAKDFVVQMRQFDRVLEKVLDVPVPEGLEERILLKQFVSNSTQASQKMPAAANNSRGWSTLSALAASVLIVIVTLMVGLEQAKPRVESPIAMENSIIEHILKHAKMAPEIMLAQTPPQTKKQMQALFAKVGATLHKPIDFISYAGECEVDGQKGLHLVLQEYAGPVTIIVMPGKVLNVMQSFEKDGLQGEMIPVVGGVVAIVGKGDQQLAMAQMQFFKAVRFG